MTQPSRPDTLDLVPKVDATKTAESLPDRPDAELLTQALPGIQPRPHHSRLLEWLKATWPELTFHHRLTRSGWYRPGGVCTSQGQILATDLEAWLNQALGKVEDFEQLLADLEIMQPLVTRFNGSTHFFTASYGKAPEACWQLEVEELQEVMDRKLLNGDAELPEDLADLLEPMHPARLDGHPVGAPKYRLGCLTNLHLALEEAVNAPLLQRFFREWQEATGDAVDFHQFWFFQRHESLTRYGVAQLRLQPHAIKARHLKTLPWDLTVEPMALATQLRSYDKAAGYNGAWYFGLVAGNLVPRELAARLQDDWLAEYRYIAERQAALIRDWLHQPYTL
ncbi:hypothetical protein [Marinospirillum alkaliphilum]|uniref:Uncharacterized protein n=1 Tax=Marinospirillum alkaliphilum DSM 21637 TaxID=1122209 RepID=A0A1K1YHH0_9GAMM|nr:hypothetical protein [Marinospirillum alkaliphilum]SFX61369.1 hypothetical protein SAMN02745752_02250 [Marinospirillum alkaliphilum DSM 21637]